MMLRTCVLLLSFEFVDLSCGLYINYETLSGEGLGLMLRYCFRKDGKQILDLDFKVLLFQIYYFFFLSALLWDCSPCWDHWNGT